MMNDIVTFGESMVALDPSANGPLRHVHDFKKHMAGAETNVLIGMSRLGHRTSWLSKVGDDEFGKYILSTLRSEGIDISRVKIEPNTITGVMFKEKRNNRQLNVYYYRQSSAASFINEEDIHEDWIRNARLLHITGITPALSSTCLAAVRKAVRIAKEAGVPISFDPNLRLKLWDREVACETLLSLIPDCTYFLPGYSEGKILTGIDSIEQMAESFHQMGAGTVVIKHGKEGAYLYDQNGGRWIKGYPVENVADPIGAGDAFAAGFLSGILNGDSHENSVKRGNLLGSYAVTMEGDWEGLPDLMEIEQMFSEDDTNR